MAASNSCHTQSYSRMQSTPPADVLHREVCMLTLLPQEQQVLPPELDCSWHVDHPEPASLKHKRGSIVLPGSDIYCKLATDSSLSTISGDWQDSGEAAFSATGMSPLSNASSWEDVFTVLSARKESDADGEDLRDISTEHSMDSQNSSSRQSFSWIPSTPTADGFHRDICMFPALPSLADYVPCSAFQPIVLVDAEMPGGTSGLASPNQFVGSASSSGVETLTLQR